MKYRDLNKLPYCDLRMGVIFYFLKARQNTGRRLSAPFRKSLVITAVAVWLSEVTTSIFTKALHWRYSYSGKRNVVR